MTLTQFIRKLECADRTWSLIDGAITSNEDELWGKLGFILETNFGDPSKLSGWKLRAFNILMDNPADFPAPIET